MYEANLIYLDEKSYTFVLEKSQVRGFLDSIVKGKPFIDEKNDIIVWLPLDNLRLLIILPKGESKRCLENQNSDQESVSQS